MARANAQPWLRWLHKKIPALSSQGRRSGLLAGRLKSRGLRRSDIPFENNAGILFMPTSHAFFLSVSLSLDGTLITDYQ